MEILYAICCGLDVHKDSVTACLRRLEAATGQVTKELRTFGTTTPALLTLLDWLVVAGCTHVAMESTGQYWKRRQKFSYPQDIAAGGSGVSFTPVPCRYSLRGYRRGNARA